MRRLRFAHVFLIGIGLIACDGCGASPAPKTDPAKPSTIAAGMTGGLSEEEFKALFF